MNICVWFKCLGFMVLFKWLVYLFILICWFGVFNLFFRKLINKQLNKWINKHLYLKVKLGNIKIWFESLLELRTRKNHTYKWNKWMNEWINECMSVAQMLWELMTCLYVCLLILLICWFGFLLVSLQNGFFFYKCICRSKVVSTI